MGLIDTLRKIRNSKKGRITIIGFLFIVVLFLLLFWGKAKGILIVILVFLAIAMGIEGFNYDADLQKLWETKSYSESRIETIKDSDGNSVRVITGNCNRVEFDMNCSSFATQAEAQAKYNECAQEIALNNPGIDINKLDVYGLDGNNNGIVCEALPSN